MGSQRSPALSSQRERSQPFKYIMAEDKHRLRINDPLIADEIIKEGKADLVCIGRGLLKELQSLIKFQKRQIEKHGVKSYLANEVSIDTVKAMKPDVVILATGSVPFFVQIMTEFKLTRVEDNGVVVTGKDNNEVFLEAERVVITAGSRPNNRLYEKINDLGEVHQIGACLESRSAKEAIYEGAVLAVSSW